MLRYVIVRLLSGVLLMLALTLVTFVLFLRIPVDPAIYVADRPTEQERARINHELGVDRPVLVQWGKFVKRLVTEGSLGNSLFGSVAVNSILKRSLAPTASLVAGGFALLLLLAVPLGVLSALRPQTVFDRSVFTLAILGIVLHPFVIGLILRGVVANRWHLAPDGGYCPLSAPPPASLFGPQPCGGLAAWASHLWLPWITFAFFFLPLYTRMVRARVLENLGARYVLTARAKGASEWRVVSRHVSRNAAGPVIAMLAMDVGTVVTAAIYIETIFGLGGIGSLVAQNLSGSHGYDLHVLVGVVFVVAAAITVLNLLADFATLALDPRIRLGKARSA